MNALPKWLEYMVAKWEPFWDKDRLFMYMDLHYKDKTF